MQLKQFVSASTVSSILKSGGFSGDGYRLLDCTSAVVPRGDYKLFKEKYYGKFEELMKQETKQKAQYLSTHIPEAVHADWNVATYPTKYEFYARYPADIFKNYARLLGINNDDQIVLYGRGPIHGMMFTSAFAWLLKSYGHERVSILDGGLAQWEKHGGDLTNELPNVKPGNWVAPNDQKNKMITFEELEKKDSAGNSLLDKIGSVNFLDTRERKQFEGTGDTGFDPTKVPGTNIPGTKNAPAVELFTKDGLLRPADELRKWLVECGYERDKSAVTFCNRGLQGAMVALLLENVYGPNKARVYSGSLKEIEQRDPKRISGGKKLSPQ